MNFSSCIWFAAVFVQCVNVHMLQAMLWCRAADDMAKGNQTSSTKLGTDVDERLQKDSSNAKLIYSSFIEGIRF